MFATNFASQPNVTKVSDEIRWQNKFNYLYYFRFYIYGLKVFYLECYVLIMFPQLQSLLGIPQVSQQTCYSGLLDKTFESFV